MWEACVNDQPQEWPTILLPASQVIVRPDARSLWASMSPSKGPYDLFQLLADAVVAQTPMAKLLEQVLEALVLALPASDSLPALLRHCGQEVEILPDLRAYP